MGGELQPTNKKGQFIEFSEEEKVDKFREKLKSKKQQKVFQNFKRPQQVLTKASFFYIV